MTGLTKREFDLAVKRVRDEFHELWEGRVAAAEATATESLAVAKEAAAALSEIRQHAETVQAAVRADLETTAAHLSADVQKAAASHASAHAKADEVAESVHRVHGEVLADAGKRSNALSRSIAALETRIRKVRADVDKLRKEQ